MYHASITEGVISEGEFPIPFHPFKKPDTSQLVQNMLKNQPHTLIRFISTVNRRSNFMIRLNVLILILLIMYVTFLSSASLPAKAVPFFLVLSCAFSLIYAVWAACPIQSVCKIAAVNNDEGLFAHFFIQQIPQDEYLNTFAEIIHEQDLLCKQMTIESFMLSRILYVKNKRLRLSYKTFLMGIISAGGCILLFNVLVVS